MNDTLQMTMLFDFYSDLLTDKQQEYFNLYHNEDFSLSEIAEITNISKPGVYDIITRAEKTLTQTELKTGIVQKWLETRAALEKSYPNTKDLHPAILSYFQLEKN